ncbi:hypothetical protein GIB67_028143 [Kingdonia uniflora]|uniref:RING-type E3 ubiquitin transferase n=1 Tax=Kingdonia uniflora TaxID=39325 RepID=A0A7J7KZW9_9MAGN|nr:hypothetical protein GIB67_028143 [Kingdonia uniflora]
MERIESSEVERAIRESTEANQVHVIPASQSAIEALKKRKYHEGNSTTGCVVCLDEFLHGMEITRMPCHHIFHGECIVSWLHLKNECPLCRFQMPLDTTEI